MLSRILVAAFLTVLSLPTYCQSLPANKPTTVPDYILYDHFMFRVAWLENQAEQLKAKGKDDSFMRSWTKRNAGLTDREEESLKGIAADCRAQTSAIVSAVQALASKGSTPTTSQQAQSLVSQQQQAVLNHVSQLRTTFGPARYAVLDAFVRQSVKITIGPPVPPPPFAKRPLGAAPRE